MDVTQGAVTDAGVGFTAVVNFFSSAREGGGGYSAYPATVTFSIAGLGISAPVPGVYAVTIGPPINPGFGTYGVELQGPGTLTEFFNSAATIVIPPGAVETLYTAETSFEQSGSYLLSLVGGGTLAVDRFDTLGPDVSLVVPEPGSLLLLGFGLAATAPLRRPRRG
jgi:hypothetical protein